MLKGVGKVVEKVVVKVEKGWGSRRARIIFIAMRIVLWRVLEDTAARPGA
jgi:hypothetical protein